MFNFRQLLGQTGEATAVRYLKKKKYKILELNYKNNLGEIDIIADDQGVISFIEVKTRSSKAFGNPKEAVTKRKQKKISMVALAWLKSKNKIDIKARFDVVSIVSHKMSMDIELVKNAFELNYR